MHLALLHWLDPGAPGNFINAIYGVPFNHNHN